MYCNCWPPCCLLIFRYCYNGNLAFECPEGYYCPAGTDFNWQQCPPGTYNNDTGLQAESDCKSCPGGYYCDHYAQVDPTEECTAGHYCQFGLDRATPIECNNTDVNGLCTVPGKMRNTPLNHYSLLRMLTIIIPPANRDLGRRWVYRNNLSVCLSVHISYKRYSSLTDELILMNFYTVVVSNLKCAWRRIIQIQTISREIISWVGWVFFCGLTHSSS